MKNEEIDRLTFAPWPLPDEVLVELGRIAALWTTTEQALSLFLSKMCGFELGDPRGTILFNNHSIAQKIDTLGCLVELFEESHPSLKEYPDALSKLRRAQASRNRFIHSGFHIDPDSKKLMMSYATTRGTLKTRVQEIQLVDLKRAVVEIAEANQALYKVVLGREHPLPWERPGA